MLFNDTILRYASLINTLILLSIKLNSHLLAMKDTGVYPNAYAEYDNHKCQCTGYPIE